ncbi:hypothetical protein ZWY2020_001261 [Hordeum vulgare]|nr:hypothetical protein ZWY2020_001261 [Hordeum vulgare]
MEAIAFNNQVVRFNTILQTGMSYEFTRVGFNPTEMAVVHFLYLDMEFIMTLDSRTVVMISAHRISTTICPLCFPQFGAIYSLQDKCITGAFFIFVLAYFFIELGVSFGLTLRRCYCYFCLC